MTKIIMFVRRGSCYLDCLEGNQLADLILELYIFILMTPTRDLAAAWGVLLDPLEPLEAFLGDDLVATMMTECSSGWIE